MVYSVRRRLRAAVVVAAVVVSTAFAAGAGASTTAPQTSVAAQPGLSSALLREINTLRAGRSLRPLKPSRALLAAAARQSSAMARHGFFGHASRDGSAFWRRVERSYGSTGYRSWLVGENLFWRTQVDARGALATWLGSPPHRANLLNPKWREIGISSVRAQAAPGVFGGRDVTIITADFGARSR